MPFQAGRFANRTPTSLAIAAVLIAACPILAMQQQEEDDPPLLAGPSVDTQAERPTLVRRDFSGEFQRLERHPAEAALDLVREGHALDEEQAGAIEAILAERRRALDDLVIDRLDVLIKLANGGTDADRAEAIAVLRSAMAPIMRKGQLGDRIRRHLPADAATEHRRLEREYLDAAIEDRVALLEAEGGGMGERGLRLRARAIEMLVGLGAEVKGAYERTIVQQGQRVEELVAMLDLSPEQEGKVRRVIQEYGEKTLLSKEVRDDAASRLSVFLEVAAELTREQRRKLLEHVRGEG